MGAGYKIISASKTVTTAGAPESLTSSSVYTQSVEIFAKTTNTGTISVGGSNVTSAHAPLAAGVAITLSGPAVNGNQVLFDLSQVYIDSTVNGEGVDITYITRVN